MKLNYYGNLAGGTRPAIATVDLEVNADVEKGTVLYYNSNMRGASVESGEKIIGVAAENYSATPSDLDPNAGSGRVKAIVSPDALYIIDAHIMDSCSSGADGEIFMNASATAENIANGGSRFKLKLVEKNSTGTIGLGEYIIPVSCREQSGQLIIKADGSDLIGHEDKLLVIPSVGFNYITANDKAEAVVDVYTPGNLILVSVDEENGKYIVKLDNALLA